MYLTQEVATSICQAKFFRAIALNSDVGILQKPYNERQVLHT